MAAPIFKKKEYYLYNSSKKPKILLVGPTYLFDSYKEITSSVKKLADIVLVEDNYKDILSNIEGANALIGCPRHLFSIELLEKSKSTLKWVHNPGAGIEEFLFDEFVNSEVLFTNGKIIQGPECADHALALLLALTRRIDLVLKGVEKKDLPRPIELHGKKAVVFGLGGIGLNIVQRAFGFGMRVTGIDPQMPSMINTLHETKNLDNYKVACEDADVIFVAAPHTWESQNMFDSDFFKSLLKKPYFISISRGSLTNSEDILSASREGLISGAGLDVTNPEPLELDHPLMNQENVIITPHIAGLSDHNRERSFEVIRENINRFCTGKPLQNLVNKQYGY